MTEGTTVYHILVLGDKPGMADLLGTVFTKEDAIKCVDELKKMEYVTKYGTIVYYKNDVVNAETLLRRFV